MRQLGHSHWRIVLIILNVTLLIMVALIFFGLGKKYQQSLPFDAEVSEPVAAIKMRDPVVQLEDERKLRIDLSQSEEKVYQSFNPEDLNGNSSMTLEYLNVENVSIEIDHEPCHLEDAIREAWIDTEELAAYARIDARNGLCEERTRSDHSLTSYIYRYPEYDFEITYDIFKSPDGREHSIKKLLLCPNAFYTDCTYTEDGVDIKREDWGLSFEIEKADKTGITLTCTQKTGQQLGDLVVIGYDLQDAGERNPLPLSGKRKPGKMQLKRNGSTQIVIDWEETYGKLPAGEYVLCLSVMDVYDKETVHPLMENFTDNQTYCIFFEI